MSRSACYVVFATLAFAFVGSRADALVITSQELYPIGTSQPELGKHGATGGVATASSRLYSIAHPSGVDLTIDEAFPALLRGADGSTQVGRTLDGTGGLSRARMWSGSPASSIVLHSAPYTSTDTAGVGGGKQVGSGRTSSGADHALLWSGTAGSVIDLHPTGYNNTYALDTDGTSQVGYAYKTSSGGPPPLHAMMWSGSAASAVDLHPSDYSASRLLGVNNGQQVGEVSFDQTFFNFRPALWNSTTGSFRDLMATGTTGGRALDTNGAQQVGLSIVAGQSHAYMWQGNQSTAVDLHAYLPAGYSSSYAGSIEGNTIYGYAVGPNRAIIVSWTFAVPEPSSLSLCAAVLTACRRRRAD